MGDVQSVGGSIEQLKLSQGATVSPQVRKRSSLVKAVSEQTRSKRRRLDHSSAHSVPDSKSIPPTNSSRRLSASSEALAESGTGQVDEKLTGYEAKRTKRAMRASRALQGFGSEESEGEEEAMSPPIPVVRKRPSLSRSVNPGALQPRSHISNTLMLGPLDESHVLEDGRTLSFAKGSKYRGRRGFQLAAHRICFDHGFTLSIYHTPQIITPDGSCPRLGRFTLACSQNSPKCPFRIKLNFTLDEWGRSDEDVEYEVTGFVNSHNHGPFENSTIYRAPKITGKRFWPKVDGKSIGEGKEVSPEL